MNWGKWIIAAFMFFAVFIISLVVVCMRQEMPLVSKSYYADELLYQEQIDRIANAKALVEKPAFALEGHSLKIHFKGLENLDSGRLEVFRPSDARFDENYSLHREPSAMLSIDMSKLPAGFYKVRMKWTADQKEYFVEESIQL